MLFRMNINSLPPKYEETDNFPSIGFIKPACIISVFLLCMYFWLKSRHQLTARNLLNLIVVNPIQVANPARPRHQREDLNRAEVIPSNADNRRGHRYNLRSRV